MGAILTNLGPVGRSPLCFTLCIIQINTERKNGRVYIYIYIYIYRERERERDKKGKETETKYRREQEIETHRAY